MSLEKVTLVFPSLNKLWGFVREARVNYTELIEADFTLVCNCPIADIELAKEKYDAIM